MALLRRNRVLLLITALVLVMLSVRLSWGLYESEAFSERAVNAQQDDCTSVQSFDGEGSQQTQPFQITGEAFRLDYSLQANTDTEDVSSLFISTYNADDNEFPVNSVTLENPGSDTSFVNEGAGSYYLDVGSANGTWTIDVLDCPTSPGGGGGDPSPPVQDPPVQEQEQYQYEQESTTPLMESGGPEGGPVPLLPNGACPEEFPVQGKEGCKS